MDVVYRESPLRSFQSPVQAFSLERRKQSGGAPQSEQSTLSVNVGPGTTRPGVSPRRTQSRRVYNLGGVGHCTVNTRQPNRIQFRQAAFACPIDNSPGRWDAKEVRCSRLKSIPWQDRFRAYLFRAGIEPPTQLDDSRNSLFKVSIPPPTTDKRLARPDIFDPWSVCK